MENVVESTKGCDIMLESQVKYKIVYIKFNKIVNTDET